MNQSPKILLSCQVEVEANDQGNCRVRFKIDDDDKKWTLPTSPKMMQRSWASWEAINTPKITLRYCSRRDNVEQRKAKERDAAVATTKTWVKIGDQ